MFEVVEKGLMKIVGHENVASDVKVLEEYSKDYSFAEPRKPMLVVYPKKADEVSSIVRWANENVIPITPVSSGPPRFRGDTVPSEGGIILDLSRLKRILKIDERNRVVMVEPGVTFGELVPELKRWGLRFAGPLLPRASKSVLTCFLEREPLTMPRYQWDYADPILTLNVVLGTGDVLRTGSASGPGPLEELSVDFVNPFGPGQADFFRFFMGAQGTMGIVTWATMKVELMPRLQKTYFVPSRNIENLIDFAYSLLNYGFGGVCHECLIMNNLNLAVMLAGKWPEEFNILRENLPSWVLITCLAGHRRAEEIVGIREKYLMELAREFRLEPTRVFPGAPGKEGKMVELLGNPWSEEPYWKLRYKGSCQDIFFLTTLDKVKGFLDVMCGMLLEHGYPVKDLGVYVQPLMKGSACHCEFSLPYNPAVSSEVETVKKLLLEASEALMSRGAFFSRPYGPWAKMVYSRYGEGTAILRQIKRVFDPNNILNPGKIF